MPSLTTEDFKLSKGKDKFTSYINWICLLNLVLISFKIATKIEKNLESPVNRASMSHIALWSLRDDIEQTKHNMNA